MLLQFLYTDLKIRQVKFFHHHLDQDHQDPPPNGFPQRYRIVQKPQDDAPEPFSHRPLM